MAKLDFSNILMYAPHVHYQVLITNREQEVMHQASFLTHAEAYDFVQTQVIKLGDAILSEMDSDGIEFNILDNQTYEVLREVIISRHGSSNETQYQLIETFREEFKNEFKETKRWPVMSLAEAKAEMESECQALLDQYPSATARYSATHMGVMVMRKHAYHMLSIKEVTSS